MQQYIFEDQYKGKPRKLLVLMSQDEQDYRVFCGADYLGSIRPLQDGAGIIWKTDYNILKPIAGKLGAYIQSFW